ncbi:MAG TPA: hypothetical protein VK817_17025 [Trebonia sp.]|jgi:2,4-dienoyl-CoA reductase-like NADH-dependent reductase (Old Yellow Enzyme family)|nr:hypothetical protein [Trebonia sp.]
MSRTDVPVPDVPVPYVLAPARLGPVTLRNRIIKSATYEGLSRHGLVTDALVDFHVRTAADGVGYLVSSFLSPRINRRRDSYGGPLENRARLARNVARAVRDAAGDRIAITVKLNLDDGVRGGFSLNEAVTVAQWLERDGSVDALELTAGSSLLNPMYLFKGDAPVREFAAAMPAPLRPAVRILGQRLIRPYPYRDAYLLAGARKVRDAVSLPLIVLGGITSKKVMDQAMTEGFQFVAMGRALLMEPDLVNRIREDATVTSRCAHCNKCVPTIYSAARCVLVEPTPANPAPRVIA